MKYVHCDIDECIRRNKGKRVYIFGAGQNIRFLEGSELSALKDKMTVLCSCDKIIPSYMDMERHKIDI